MKSQYNWIFVIIIGVAGLFVASRFFAPKPAEETPLVEQTAPPTENAETPSLPEDWKEYDGGDFTIAAPEIWLSFTRTDESGATILSGLKSDEQDEAYNDPDIASILITKFSKQQKTLDQVVAEKTMDETETILSVDLMKKEASSPYNEITLDDIKTSIENIQLNNGQTAIKNIFQCLKPCYLEGGAYTLTQYFLETDENIYLFMSKTGVDEKSNALALIAEQIIKTFKQK